MTQIFTGEGLGLHGSSIGQLGGYGPKGTSTLGQGGSNTYVNAANGNLVLRQADGFLAGSGFGLNLFQTYNSQGEGNGGWIFNIQTRLEVTGNVGTPHSSIMRTDEDGHKTHFLFDEKSKKYVAQDGTQASITYKNSKFLYAEGNSKVRSCYNQEGQLLSLEDKDNHAFIFEYVNNQLTTIKDTSGQQSVTWTFKNGLLVEVSMKSAGVLVHHVAMTYDDHYRLQTISRDKGDGNNYWISYGYEGDSNRLTSIRQSDGTSLTIHYDHLGRVSALIDGEGGKTMYEYHQNVTHVKTASGEIWSYYYDNHAQLISIDGPCDDSVRYQYDDKHHLIAISQGQLQWQLYYNENGDCIRLEASSGLIIARVFDEEHRLLKETQIQAFDGHHHPVNPKNSHYVYDAAGHLLFSVANDGVVSEYRYDSEGLLISKRTYLKALFLVDSNKELNILELNDWVLKQNPQEVSLIGYKYDWRGQCTEEMHFQAVTAEGVGIDATAVITKTVYDALGRLISKSIPTDTGFNTTHYTYDALGRLLQTIDSQGCVKRIEYDDSHQRIIETDVSGLQTINTFDKRGQLLSTQKLDNKTQYGATHYLYDEAGRLFKETGPDGASLWYFYDAHSRLQARINALGQVISYQYDAYGHLIQTHEFLQMVNTHLLNTHTNYESIAPKAHALDNIRQTIYDKNGFIAYQINAEGAVIEYQTNSEGLVVQKIAYANRLANFDPMRMLTRDDIKLVTHFEDRHAYYYYDAVNRLEAEVDGEGAAIAYHYDANGFLIETTRFAEKVKQHTGVWATDAPLESKWRDCSTYSFYNAAGLKTADIDALGYLKEYQYDAAGLLIEIKAYYQKVTKKPNPFMPYERPTPSSNDHVTTFRYNAFNQLCETKEYNGLVTTYAYDAAGRIVETTKLDSKSSNLRQQRTKYDALGRVIQTLDALGSLALEACAGDTKAEEAIWQKHAVTYTYDNASRILTKTNALKQTTRFFYNELGALIYKVEANGAVVETQYNAFNQVSKTIQYSAFLKANEENLSIDALAIRLERLASPKLDVTVEYTYNVLGQIILKKEGTRGQLINTYTVFGELAESRRRLHANAENVTQYQYDKRGLQTTILEDAEGISRLLKNDYDVFGRLIQSTNGRSHAKQYKYDKLGRTVLCTRDNTPGYKVFCWDAFGRMIEESDWSGSGRTLYQYDDVKNTLTITNNQSITTSIQSFNAFGNVITQTDALGNQTCFTFDAKGQLIEVKAPENSGKQYQYDALGLLIWEQNHAGHIITYTYDALGHKLTETRDPQGLNLKTTYQYDALGRQLLVEDGASLKRQFTYDNQGLLIAVALDPSGLNQLTTFEYDDNGRLTRQIVHNPKGPDWVTAYEWDALGRRTATIIDPSGLNLTTRFAYDAADNLVSQRDANGNTTHYVYDSNNQCRFSIDARGVVTERRYSINGLTPYVITYANPIEPLEIYTEATLKEALVVDDKKDEWQFYLFNSLGQLMIKYDALGYATQYVYDKNGNILRVKRYGIPYPLDNLKSGNASFPPEDYARNCYCAYDGLNRVRFRVSHDGYVMEYQYDTAGFCIKTKSYAKPIVVTIKVAEGNMDAILAALKPNQAQDKTIQCVYDAVGRLKLQVSAEGVATSYQYDGANNLVATTIHAIRLSSENTPIVSFEDRTQQSLFDAAGREIYRISAEGRVIERVYDSMGNVISEITHSKRVDSNVQTVSQVQAYFLNDNGRRISQFHYDAANRLLEHSDASNARTLYHYDNNGNVISKENTKGALWQYCYDAANQLIETRAPETSIGTFCNGQLILENRAVITKNIYDSFGNLITLVKDSEGLAHTTHFVYDGNNRLIEKHYPPVGVNEALQIRSNNRQERLESLKEITRYNAFGEVIETIDKAGFSRHFVYDREGKLRYQLDAEGGLTETLHDGFGNLIKKTQYAVPILIANGEYTLDVIAKACITNKNDRHIQYAYNKDGLLILTTKDAVRTYDANTGEYSFKCAPKTSYTYNAFNELVEQSVNISDSQSAITRFYYNREGQRSASVDALGFLTTNTYTIFGELETQTEYALGVKASDKGYSVPLSSKEDRNMHFTYDAMGRLIEKTARSVSYTEGDAKNLRQVTGDLKTTYTYDAEGNVTSTQDAKGNITYLYYDALNQCIAKIGPKTASGKAATTYVFDAEGQLLETHRHALGAMNANLETFTLQVASAHDIVTQDEYDAFGKVILHRDGMSHETYYSYDANGRLSRSWQSLEQNNQPNLIQDKRYSFDKEGRLLQTKTFKNETEYKTEDALYNAFGELTASGINGNFIKQVDYDQLGRVWRSNSKGFYELYLYDAADRLTQTVTSTNLFRPNHDEKGIDLSSDYYIDAINFDKGDLHFDFQCLSNQYDVLGRLLKQKTSFADFSREKTGDPFLKSTCFSQTLDRWGNVLTHINANLHETRYTYNAFNQVIQQELPQVLVMNEKGASTFLSPVTHYAYDALGKMIAITDANGHTIRQVYDAMGRVFQEIDAKGYVREKRYNNLGELILNRNERGALTYYEYDQNNRLISIKTSNTAQYYQYDAEGQLLSQKNALGEGTLYAYDSLGNQISKREANGSETRYFFDDAGHKTREIDALGKTQTWVYEKDLLKAHIDLGGHTTTYTHNANGLVLTEASTFGKHFTYHYFGNGQLRQFVDDTRTEVINFTYDDEGRVLSREGGRAGDFKDGWIRETDKYEYDALGRLVSVRRRHPEDKSEQYPDKDHALLSIDYAYDAVGNIRRTQVMANYTGYQPIKSEDYYLYDENNRMVINKGSLINGDITIIADKGSALTYDGAGNIIGAKKQELGYLQEYLYQYNAENAVELTLKNGNKLQAKTYDKAGRVEREHAFDANNYISQINIMAYSKGLLQSQKNLDAKGRETAQSFFIYDDLGHLTQATTVVHAYNGKLGSTSTHKYTYDGLFDSYQQTRDEAQVAVDKHQTSYGVSTRVYDVNGQLQDAFDVEVGQNGLNHTTHYWASGIDGIRARMDEKGQTSYLNIGSKTIGDLRLDKAGAQHLNVYGGFTPTGSQQVASFESNFVKGISQTIKTLGRNLVTTNKNPRKDRADGTLPETPEDNLGSYTMQAGETLETVALKVYGDSSLWYLLADANGVTDRNAVAGVGSQLHVGQRLIIPAANSSQHNTNSVHKVNINTVGDTSATTPIPLPLPTPKKSHGFFSSLIVAIVATVATVMTAGALGTLFGGEILAGIQGLLSTGTSVLGGGVFGAMGSTSAGLMAGFTGNIVSQGVANLLDLQKGIQVDTALLAGVGAAATAGLLGGVGASSRFKELQAVLDGILPSPDFNLATAAQAMAGDAFSQGANLAFNQQSRFNWKELGASSLTGGLLGGKHAKELEQTVHTQFPKGANLINTEARALLEGGAQSFATHSQFNAENIIKNTLGNAVGNTLMQAGTRQREVDTYQDVEEPTYLSETLQNILNPERLDETIYLDQIKSEKLQKHSAENKQMEYAYSAIPEKETFSALPEGYYERENSMVVRENAKHVFVPTPFDTTWVNDTGMDVDSLKLVYESNTKMEINKVLRRAGSIHRSTMMSVSVAPNLKETRGVFKTKSSQSYRSADKTIKSVGYQFLDKFGKVLSGAYISMEISNAYAVNKYENENVRRREVVSAGTGAWVEVCAEGFFVNGVGIVGGLIGVMGGPIAGAFGYAAGSQLGIRLYNDPAICDYVNGFAKKVTRASWNYIENTYYKINNRMFGGHYF